MFFAISSPTVATFCMAPSYGESGTLDQVQRRRLSAVHSINSGDRAHPWASPLFTKDLGKLPPATIITAECDPLRDEGKAYAEKLNAAGTPASYKDYAGVFHGFASLFGMLPEGDQAVAQSAAALKAAFAKGGAA